MKRKVSMNDIGGGDTLRLKDGKEIKVYDIRGKYIIASFSEWYHIDDVEEIVKKYDTRK